MTKVKIENLRAGMILAADIKNMDDVLLAPAGCEVSDRFINIFQTWGINEVQIEGAEDAQEAVEVEVTVTPEILDEMKAQFWSLDETNPVHVEILNIMARRLARHKITA